MKIRKPIQQGTALVPCRTKGENSFKKIGSIAGKVLLALLLILLLLAVFGTAAHAAGLVDDTVDAANEYSKYPLDNYQLDFYVDSGWDWLPWNWLDGIGKQVTMRDRPREARDQLGRTGRRRQRWPARARGRRAV